MPAVDISLVPENVAFVVRLMPIEGWPDSPDGFQIPEQAQIARILGDRFGVAFDVTDVQSAWDFAAYQVAGQRTPSSGYTIAQAIANGIAGTMLDQRTVMPDMDVRISRTDQPSAPVGHSHTGNRPSVKR